MGTRSGATCGRWTVRKAGDSAPAGETQAAAWPRLRGDTYVLEGDDVGVLAIPQQDLDLLRGVSPALVDDLEQTGVAVGLPRRLGRDPLRAPPAGSAPVPESSRLPRSSGRPALPAAPGGPQALILTYHKVSRDRVTGI